MTSNLFAEVQCSECTATNLSQLALVTTIPFTWCSFLLVLMALIAKQEAEKTLVN